MTNSMVEHLTGSLWMVTKAGNNANCLGRVYRDKNMALTHKDFDEIVVELRLADEPKQRTADTRSFAVSRDANGCLQCVEDKP